MKRVLSILLIACMLLTQFAVIALAEGAEAGTFFPLDDHFSEANTGKDYGNDLYYQERKMAGLPNTFEAWVYFDSADSTANGVLFGNYHENGNYVNFAVQNGNPRVYWIDSFDNAYDCCFTGVSVIKSEWTHFAIVNDESTHELRCYMNGELKETKSYYPAYDIENNECYFTVGGDQRRGNTNPFRGAVKGITVYGDVRSAAEIATDYATDKAAGCVPAAAVANVTDGNLLAAYDFSAQYAKTNIKDISLNGVDLIYSDMWGTAAEVDALFADSEMERAFSLAVVGDTQMLLDYAPENFSKIYEWIVASKEAEKIEYVIGVGDITDDNDNVNEWPVAVAGIKMLNDKIPYSLVRGNHDVWGDKNPPYIDQYFANDSYYTAQFADGKGGYYADGSVLNTWTTFTPAGSNVDFLLLNLDYCPADAVVEWAKGVVEAHPDHKIILNTHAYTNGDGRHYDINDITLGSLKSTPYDLNAGDLLWEKLVSKYENFSMVFCGHVYSEHVKVTQRQGDNGNTVTEFLINPQSTDREFTSAANGTEGVGNVALLHFNADATEMQVEYYSTIQEAYYRTNSCVELDLVNGDIRETPDYTVWHGTEEEPAGTGTAADPYLISSASNLLWMARRIDPAYDPTYRTTKKSVSNPFEGCYFKQTQDIDLGGLTIPSIGYYYSTDADRYAFAGSYDGGGHKIHNGIIVPYTTDGTRAYGSGLFGMIWGATIKDVHLDNVTVVGEGPTGAIVGKAAGPESGMGAPSFNMISNCSISNSCEIVCVTENITPTAYDNNSRAGVVGSVVGIARSATVNYCTSAATLKVPGIYGMAGGIAGTVGYYSAIDHCAFTGSIQILDNKGTQPISVGGIAGAISPALNTTDNGDAKIGPVALTNSYNSGSLLYNGGATLTASSHWGGILGYAGELYNIAATETTPYPYLMENCHNTYAIDVGSALTASDSDWSGGLVGKGKSINGGASGTLYVLNSSSVAITQAALSATVTNEWRNEGTNASGNYAVMAPEESVKTLSPAEQEPIITALDEEIGSYSSNDTTVESAQGKLSVTQILEAYATDGIEQIYMVYTVADLVYISQYSHYIGAEDSVLLCSDLTIGETFTHNGATLNFADSFTGFAGSDTFLATFDGQGHTITGYNDTHALFAMAVNGTVCNLTLKDAVVNATTDTSSILLRNTTDTVNIDNVHLAHCILNTTAVQNNGLMVAYNHSASTTTSITNCSISDSAINATGATLRRTGLVIGFFSATNASATNARTLTLENCVVENSHITATAMASDNYTGLLVGSTNNIGILGLTFNNVAVLNCSLTASGATAPTTAAVIGMQKAQSATLTMNNIFAFGNKVNAEAVRQLAYGHTQYHPATYAFGTNYSVDSGIMYVMYDNDTPADSAAIDAAKVVDTFTVSDCADALNANTTGIFWKADVSNAEDPDVKPISGTVTFNDGGTTTIFFADDNGKLAYTGTVDSLRDATEADFAAIKAKGWFEGTSTAAEDIVSANTEWEKMTFATAKTYNAIPLASTATADDTVTAYQINNVKELVAASKMSNALLTTDVIYITADLDIRDYEGGTAQFATDFENFANTARITPSFDGLGHTISYYTSSKAFFCGKNWSYPIFIRNITFDHATLTASTYSGLFVTKWDTGASAEGFTNVHVRNSSISTSVADGTTSGMGIFVGLINGERTLNFLNCSAVNNTVTGTNINDVGIFVGRSCLIGTVTVENCVAENNRLYAATVSGGAETGLLIGNVGSKGSPSYIFNNVAVLNNTIHTATADHNTAVLMANNNETGTTLTATGIFAAGNLHTYTENEATVSAAINALAYEITSGHTTATFTNAKTDAEVTYLLYSNSTASGTANTGATAGFTAADALVKFNESKTYVDWLTGTNAPTGKAALGSFYTDQVNDVLYVYNGGWTVLSTSEHLYGEWCYDDHGHWKECDCGFVYGPFDHDLSDHFDQGGYWVSCDCGYQSALQNTDTCGDLNEDGKRNLLDVMIMLRILAGYEYKGNLNTTALFLNGDTVADMADAVILLRVAAGWQYDLIPPPANAQILCDPTTKQYYYEVA